MNRLMGFLMHVGQSAALSVLPRKYWTGITRTWILQGTSGFGR